MSKTLKYLHEMKKVMLSLSDDEILNMNEYRSECGTLFCVFGHCIDKSQFFKEEGWDFHKSNLMFDGENAGILFPMNHLGLTYDEFWSICSETGLCRLRNAEMACLPTQINHFHTDTPTPKDAAEAIDLLIERYAACNFQRKLEGEK